MVLFSKNAKSRPKMADGTKGLAANTAFKALFDKEFDEAKDKGQINPKTTK